MLGSPYHPQRQGAIEVFKKNIQNSLYKAYDNISKSNDEEKEESLIETWNLNLKINSFLHYYNWRESRQQQVIFQEKYSLITTMKKIIEDVIINTVKMRSKFLEL